MTYGMDHVLELGSAAHPGRLALTLGDQALSFGDMQARVNRMARALAAHGVGAGDRLLCHLDLAVELVDLFFAASRLGAVFVPSNPKFSASELGAIIDYLQPRLMIVDGTHEALGRSVTQASGVPLAVIGSAAGTAAGFDLSRAVERAADGPLDLPRARQEATQVMYLTSGSTGTPKAVMVSQRANWLRSFVGATYGCNSGGRGIACMFPLFHMAGWMMLASAWTSRRAVHLTLSTEGEELLRLVDRWQAADLYCIPAVWRRVLAARGDGSSLRVAATGTSRVEMDLIEALRARFPAALNSVGYGSTEMGSAMVLAHDEMDSHPGSVGLPAPGMEARIVDGELCLRAPTMMDGYYAMPEATADVVRDGWYHTGDLAAQNGDGFFEITGRRREIIRSGGETIAPVEVDAALAELPGVGEVAVVGLPDSLWGEIVCAAIVPAAGCALPSLEHVRACVAHLAPFKHPRSIVCVDHIPRTPATGQVQRGQLRDMILAGGAYNPAGGTAAG